MWVVGAGVLVEGDHSGSEQSRGEDWEWEQTAGHPVRLENAHEEGSREPGGWRE